MMNKELYPVETDLVAMQVRDRMPFSKIALIAIGLLGVAVSQAATISWTAHNITGDVSDISTKGTLVEARNGSDTTEVTVNGVTFQNSTNSGNLFDSLFNNDNIRDRGWGQLNSIMDTNYRNLLTFGQRSGRPNFNDPPRTSPANDWATVTFTDLTVGKQYEIQIFASDSDAPLETVQTKGLLLGDGSPGSPAIGKDTLLHYEMTENGAGQYGIGTFVADSTTQTFNVRKATDLSGSPQLLDHDHFSNGLQLRDLGPAGSSGANTLSPDYTNWSSRQNWTVGAAGTGESDDHDQDGLTNNEERIFGLDPTDASSKSPYVIPFDPAAGTFSYTRRLQTLTKLNYTVWYSTDKTAWVKDTGATQVAGPPANQIETVKVKISPDLLKKPELYVVIHAEAP